MSEFSVKNQAHHSAEAAVSQNSPLDVVLQVRVRRLRLAVPAFFKLPAHIVKSSVVVLLNIEEGRWNLAQMMLAHNSNPFSSQSCILQHQGE